MKLIFFSLSLFYSSFGSEALTIASLKSGEGQELSSTSWREGRIYIHYLEFFCLITSDTSLYKELLIILCVHNHKSVILFFFNYNRASRFISRFK